MNFDKLYELMSQRRKEDPEATQRVHEIYQLFKGGLIYDSDRKMLFIDSELLLELDAMIPKNDLLPDTEFAVVPYTLPDGRKIEYVRLSLELNGIEE